MRRRAIVRQVADSFVNATSAHPLAVTIDVGRARRQHADYVAALLARLDEVEVLAADERFPDGPFVEDQAVVARGKALITRSGHPGRRGEAEAIAAVLTDWCDVEGMEAPATLDGGDVLQIGRTLLVGRSARTNAGGVEALRACFEPMGLAIRAVDVPRALHLKSVCSAPADDIVLLAAGTLDPAIFVGLADVRLLHGVDPIAANTVGLGQDVLVPAHSPVVGDVLLEAGLTPVPIDVSEFNKADGALTCLSILV